MLTPAENHELVELIIEARLTAKNETVARAHHSPDQAARKTTDQTAFRELTEWLYEHTDWSSIDA